MSADLDETSALVLEQAIAAAAAPLPVQVVDGEVVRDPRSKRQRDLDALVALVETGAAASAPAVAQGARVSVLATVADVDAALGQRSGQSTATVDGHGPISATAAGYLVCGAALRRVLTSPAGAVLDLGRNTRLATPAQRQALAVRDGGCVAPGCTTAPWACEAHHVPAWEDDGQTDLDAMVLLCPTHHRAWHTHHLEVRFRADRTVEARWVTWSTRWPGQSTPHPWVAAPHPGDRAATRELAARLRAGDDPPHQRAG